MRQVILFGYSGHSYVAIDILMILGYKIKGYVLPKSTNVNPFNIAYLGTDEDILLRNELSNYVGFIGIGENLIRKKLYDLISNKIELISLIHPSCIFSSNTKINKGTLISAHTTINALATIGKGCIINTGAIVEHECVIDDFAHIAPGAVLAGNVSVGECSFIGANSVVKQGIKIGKNVTIGAGTVVLKDVPDGATVVGNPGRIIKSTN